MEENKKSKWRLFFESVASTLAVFAGLTAILHFALNGILGSRSVFIAGAVVGALMLFVWWPFDEATSELKKREAERGASIYEEAMNEATRKLTEAQKFIEEFGSYGCVLDSLKVIQHDYREGLAEAEVLLDKAAKEKLESGRGLAEIIRLLQGALNRVASEERHLREAHRLATARGHEIPPIEQFLKAEQA